MQKKSNVIVKLFIPFLLFPLILTGCYSSSNWGCIRGNGKVITETRDLKDFQEVTYESSGVLYISQGEQEQVRIEAEENILPSISTRVSRGNLTIDQHDCTHRTRTINVYVTLKEFKGVQIEGSADVIGETPLKGDLVDIATYGSGDMNLEIQANGLEATISGSGDMSLSGKTSDLDITIRGSGDIQARKLEASKVAISIFGSGDTTVQAKEDISVSIFGSGDVYYLGRPVVSDLSIHGSGDFKRLK